jgi:hypothetical protein
MINKTAHQLKMEKMSWRHEIIDSINENLERIKTFFDVDRLEDTDLITLEKVAPTQSEFDEQVSVTITGILSSGSKVELSDGLEDPILLDISKLSDNVLLEILQELEQMKAPKDVEIFNVSTGSAK